MAFDAGYADKINNALEEYRQDESEMRQNAPGAENFNTEAEGTKKPEIKKEPVDGSVEITFDPDGMTANMILHKAYNGGRPVTAAIVMAELLKRESTPESTILTSDRKSTRLNSSHNVISRMPSSA